MEDEEQPDSLGALVRHPCAQKENMAAARQPPLAPNNRITTANANRASLLVSPQTATLTHDAATTRHTTAQSIHTHATLVGHIHFYIEPSSTAPPGPALWCVAAGLRPFGPPAGSRARPPVPRSNRAPLLTRYAERRLYAHILSSSSQLCGPHARGVCSITMCEIIAPLAAGDPTPPRTAARHRPCRRVSS